MEMEVEMGYFSTQRIPHDGLDGCSFFFGIIHDLHHTGYTMHYTGTGGGRGALNFERLNESFEAMMQRPSRCTKAPLCNSWAFRATAAGFAIQVALRACSANKTL